MVGREFITRILSDIFHRLHVKCDRIVGPIDRARSAIATRIYTSDGLGLDWTLDRLGLDLDLNLENTSRNSRIVWITCEFVDL